MNLSSFFSMLTYILLVPLKTSVLFLGLKFQVEKILLTLVNITRNNKDSIRELAVITMLYMVQLKCSSFVNAACKHEIFRTILFFFQTKNNLMYFSTILNNREEFSTFRQYKIITICTLVVSVFAFLPIY